MELLPQDVVAVLEGVPGAPGIGFVLSEAELEQRASKEIYVPVVLVEREPAIDLASRPALVVAHAVQDGCQCMPAPGDRVRSAPRNASEAGL